MTAVPQVDPRDVPEGATIIDVREDYEWEGGHATGAMHITLGTLTERLAELPAPGEDFYVICHGGGRSNRAATFLREHGYADDAFFEEVAESAQKVASGVRDAVLSSEVADFEHFFDRVYAQEHQQVEDDREFYRTYNAGFEEE